MPNANIRREGIMGRNRVKAKYELVLEKNDPRRFNPPIVKATQPFRDIMKTKNYIRIQTQLQECQYIIQQHFIYCEEDIWVCGDAMVLNQNPDRAIMVKVMCTRTKNVCIAYHEHTNQFISICPECKKVVTAIKDTPFKCPHCNLKLKEAIVNRLPFAKLNCEVCPARTGWEEAVNNVETIKKSLKKRSNVMEEEYRERINEIK